MSKQSQKIRLHREQNSLCLLCELPITLANATIEHIIPVSEGGSNNIKNLAVSHGKCNAKRGTLPIPVFKAFLAFKANGGVRNMGWWLKREGWEHNPSTMRWKRVDENSAVPNTVEVQPVKHEPSTPSTRVESYGFTSEAARHRLPQVGVFALGVNSPCTCRVNKNFFCIGRGYCCEVCWREYEGMNRWDGHKAVLK